MSRTSYSHSSYSFDSLRLPLIPSDLPLFLPRSIYSSRRPFLRSDVLLFLTPLVHSNFLLFLSTSLYSFQLPFVPSNFPLFLPTSLFLCLRLPVIYLLVTIFHLFACDSPSFICLWLSFILCSWHARTFKYESWSRCAIRSHIFLSTPHEMAYAFFDTLHRNVSKTKPSFIRNRYQTPPSSLHVVPSKLFKKRSPRGSPSGPPRRQAVCLWPVWKGVSHKESSKGSQADALRRKILLQLLPFEIHAEEALCAALGKARPGKRPKSPQRACECLGGTEIKQ